MWDMECDVRKTVEQFHENVFLQANKTSIFWSKELGVDIVKLQTCGRQTQGSNVPSIHWREWIFSQIGHGAIFYHLLRELNDKFLKLYKRAVTGMTFVSSEMSLKSQIEGFSIFSKILIRTALLVISSTEYLMEGKNNVPNNLVETEAKYTIIIFQTSNMSGKFVLRSLLFFLNTWGALMFSTFWKHRYLCVPR